MITGSHGEENKAFLDASSPELKSEIINGIATHYGATPDVIYDEVTARDAYHLTEYMTEPQRGAVFLMMQVADRVGAHSSK